MINKIPSSGVKMGAGLVVKQPDSIARLAAEMHVVYAALIHEKVRGKSHESNTGMR